MLTWGVFLVPMMTMMMPMEESMPAEAEPDMIPDEQMEDEYLDFIISQSLSSEEEMTMLKFAIDHNNIEILDYLLADGLSPNNELVSSS